MTEPTLRAVVDDKDTDVAFLTILAAVVVDRWSTNVSVALPVTAGMVGRKLVFWLPRKTEELRSASSFSKMITGPVHPEFVPPAVAAGLVQLTELPVADGSLPR